jgi:lysophospholipase L1-like esterase
MAHLRDRRAFGNIGTRKFRGARFGDPLSPRGPQYTKEGLILDYSTDVGPFTIIDQSGQDNTATLYSGRGLTMDAVGDTVTYATGYSSASRTATLWGRFNTTSPVALLGSVSGFFIFTPTATGVWEELTSTATVEGDLAWDLGLDFDIGDLRVGTEHWTHNDWSDPAGNTSNGKTIVDSGPNQLHGTCTGCSGFTGEATIPQTADKNWNKYDWNGGSPILSNNGNWLVSEADTPNGFVWPSIADDNAISDELGTDVTGWTSANGTLTEGAEFATFSSSANDGYVEKVITMPTSGDYMIYFKAKPDQNVNGLNHISIRSETQSKLFITFGYNWDTSSYELGRVSFAVRNAGGLSKMAGKASDPSGAPTTVAVYYSAAHGAFSFYILEGGKWKFYGSANSDAAYGDRIRYGASGTLPDADIYYTLIARPNIVSVGSSITSGYAAFSPDPDDNNKVYNHQWQYSVLANIYPDLRNTLVVNEGVPGENTSELDTRMTTLTSTASARLFLCEASANDFGAGFTQAQRTTNINSYIGKAQAAGATAVLFNTVYPNSDQGANFPASGDYYREWWEDYRDQVSPTAYIDPMLSLKDGTGYLDPAYTEPDGVHPNVAGHAVLGTAILEGYKISSALIDALGNAILEPRRNTQQLNLFGEGEYSSTPDSDSLDVTTAATWELWGNPYYLPASNQSWFSKTNISGVRSWQIYKDATRNNIDELSITLNGVEFGSEIRGLTNKISHIVFTKSGTTLLAYVDGIEVATFPTVGTVPASIYVGTEPVMIGGRLNNVVGNFCERKIGSAKIYNRALTADEVLTNYESQKSLYLNVFPFTLT